MTQKYQVKVSMKQAAIVETGIVLKQGDFGMQIEIEVLDFDATGTTPQIVFRKAMGAVESTTITVSGNKYTYTFKGTELDTPGKCFCDLKLKNSTTQRISTASFMFRVVADTLDGLAEEASSYSDTIAQIVGTMENEITDIWKGIESDDLNNRYGKEFSYKWGQGVWVDGALDGRATDITIIKVYNFIESTNVYAQIPDGFVGLYCKYSDPRGETRTAVGNLHNGDNTLQTGYYTFALEKSDHSSITPDEGADGIYTINYINTNKIGFTPLPTTAQTLTGAIAEHEGDIINLNNSSLEQNTEILNLNKVNETFYLNNRYMKEFSFDWAQGVWVDGKPDGRSTHICINRIFTFLTETTVYVNTPSGYACQYSTYSDPAGETRTAVTNISVNRLHLAAGYYSFSMSKSDSSAITPSSATNGIFTIPYILNDELAEVKASIKSNFKNEINGKISSFSWGQGIWIDGELDNRATAISIDNVFTLSKATVVYVNIPNGYKLYYNTYSDENGVTRTAINEITGSSVLLSAGYYSFYLAASNGTDPVSLSVGVDGIVLFKYDAELNAVKQTSLLSENVFRNTDTLYMPYWEQGVVKVDQTTDNRVTAIRTKIYTTEKAVNLKCVFDSNSYKVVLAIWDTENTNTKYAYITSGSLYTVSTGYKFALAVEKNPSGNMTPEDGNNISTYTVSSLASTQFLSGLKIGILGDSITARGDASYWEAGIEAITGADVTRYGHGGTMIENDNTGYSFLDRYDDMDLDTNIIIVEGGTNDWGNNGTLGQLDYTENQYTLYGALMILFKGIQDTYPNAKVYVCTPPQRDYHGPETASGMGYNTASTPWTFAQCQQAIKDMAYYWGFEVIDLFAKLGWNTNNIDDFTSDGLHPNEAGYKRMVSVVCSQINHAMNEF